MIDRRRSAGVATTLSWIALFVAAEVPAARAETIVITGATLQTLGPLGVIKNGTLVIEDGKIRAVGSSVALMVTMGMISTVAMGSTVTSCVATGG